MTLSASSVTNIRNAKDLLQLRSFFFYPQDWGVNCVIKIKLRKEIFLNTARYTQSKWSFCKCDKKYIKEKTCNNWTPSKPEIIFSIDVFAQTWYRCASLSKLFDRRVSLSLDRARSSCGFLYIIIIIFSFRFLSFFFCFSLFFFF